MVVSWTDRQLLALLVEPIKHDFALQDWQVGVLQGVAFAIFFAVGGLPLGYAADRGNRRNILFAGAIAWSLMTSACGFAGSFVGLFLARIGVAVGEASLRPCADSMIADLFPPSRLGLAFAIYMAGMVMGIGGAFILGATAVGWITRLGPLSVPGFGQIAVWQAAFLVIGLAGFPAAFLVLLVREPARTGLGHAGAAGPSLRATGRYVAGRWKIYLAHFAGFGLAAAVGQANNAWAVTFFVRTFGWSAAQAGLTYGVLVLVFSTAGVFAGGLASRRLALAGDRAAFWRTALYSQLLATPVGLFAYAMPSASLTVAALACSLFVQSTIAAMNPASLQAVTHNEHRGQLIALTTVASVIFALSAGPTLVGLITDLVFRDPKRIGCSLMLLNATLTPAAALVFWRSLPLFRRNLVQPAVDAQR